MAGDVKDTLIVKQLRTGAYVSSAAAAGTGYVIIKTEDGTDRKYLVYV